MTETAIVFFLLGCVCGLGFAYAVGIFQLTSRKPESEQPQQSKDPADWWKES